MSALLAWVVPVAIVGVIIAGCIAYCFFASRREFSQEHTYESCLSKEHFAQYEKNEVHYVTNPWDIRPIKYSASGPSSWKPQTVFEVFDKAVENAADSIIMKKEYKNDAGEFIWKDWTLSQYQAACKQAARAFIELGLQPWESVGIIGFNSPQWFISEIGAMYAGGLAVGIYTTNNAGQCKYIAQHSKARIVVVENEKQLNKFLQVRDELEGTLSTIIVWDCDAEGDIVKNANDGNHNVRVIDWAQFMKLGSDENGKQAELNEIMSERMAAIQPEQCCMLIYTSGTTGPPKGVMVSHDSITNVPHNLLVSSKHLKKEGNHAIVSYLPLSHIAANLCDIHNPLAVLAHYPKVESCTVYFGRADALKGSLKITLQAAQPTIFFGPPRVWEKFYEAIKKKAQDNPASALRAKLVNFMKTTALKAHYNREVAGNKRVPIGYGLAETKLFPVVRSAFGFDRLQAAITGAAPVQKQTLEFFASVGIHLVEAYGMSETSGLHNMALPYYSKLCTVGPAMRGYETCIKHDPGRDKEGEGEICMRGRNIMMGYMYDPDKTRETIDEFGWLHSGDVGSIDEHGLLRITGRIKELIITAGGENIAPVPIEDFMREACGGISNCVIIGDKRKYLTMLITLKCVQNMETMQFTNELAGDAVFVDADCKSVDDAMKSGVWKKYIQDGVDKYNNDKDCCVSRAQKLQYFTILVGDFSVEGRELTATMKMIRPNISEKYVNEIEAMYDGAQTKKFTSA